MTARPVWVRDVLRTDRGALVVVARTDGRLTGYRMATRSLRELAKRRRR